MNSTQTVESLIQEIREDLDLDEKGLIKISNYMLRFIVSLSAGVAPNIKWSYESAIPSSKVVNLPDDYIEYITIGYIVNGILIEMSSNGALIPSGVPAGVQVQEQAALYPSLIQTDLTGYLSSDMKGLRPAGVYGSFNVNKSDRVVELDPMQYIPNLYILYKSDCIEVSEKTLVHPFAQDAAILYSKFNYLRDRYNDNRHLKYEKDLNKAMRELPSRLNPVSLKDCIDALDMVRGFMFGFGCVMIQNILF